MYVADLSSTLRDLNEDELNTDFDEIANPFEPVKGLAVELSIYFNLAKMIRYGWPKESVNNHLFYMFNLWTSFILDIIQNGYDEQKQVSCISFYQRNSISKTFTISIARVRIPLMLS